MAANDKIFNHISVDKLKTIANYALENLQVIIFERPRIINDPKMISEILQKTHNTPTRGHIGQNKMYKKLRKEFYWYNMKKTIAQLVKSCEYCKLNKHQKHTKEKYIKTTTPYQPFEIISVDTVGPFNKSHRNNRYAVTIQCDLSKYIVVIPIQNKEAHTIAKAIVENFMLIFGTNIKAIRTDMGTEYKNTLFENINKYLNITHITSTAYHPETIGALERSHKSLNEFLRIFCNETKEDWDKWVHYFSYAYNTTPHIAHNYAPFELVFGRVEKIQNDLIKNKIDPIYNVEDYYLELKYRLQVAFQRTREYLEQSKNNLITKQDKINPIQLAVGSKVALKNENRKKLDAVYKGPFIVEKILDPNIIIKCPVSNISQTVHKNRLIKF